MTPFEVNIRLWSDKTCIR